jgi:hypothetical protein
MTQNALNTTKPIPIVKGGTGQTTLINSGVVYYDGVELNSTIAGTAGQVFTSNGPSAAPTFQASPSGTLAWNLIQTQTVSSVTSISFASIGSYETYALVLGRVYFPSGSGTNILLVFSSNGGSSYVTSGYLTNIYYIDSGSTGIANYGAINGYTTSAVMLSTGVGTLSGGSIGATFFLYGLNTTSGTPTLRGSNWNQKSVYQFASVGWLGTAGLYNALQITCDGTTTISGTFSLYGLSQ